jgi:hypothetical protein
VDAGPVQHHGRRRHPLHAHAQDHQDPVAGPEVHFLQIVFFILFFYFSHILSVYVHIQ